MKPNLDQFEIILKEKNNRFFMAIPELGLISDPCSSLKETHQNLNDKFNSLFNNIKNSEISREKFPIKNETVTYLNELKDYSIKKLISFSIGATLLLLIILPITDYVLDKNIKKFKSIYKQYLLLKK